MEDGSVEEKQIEADAEVNNSADTMEVQEEPPRKPTTTEKILEYCAGLDSWQQADGVTTTGAPPELRKEALTVLEELAVQILHTFATSTYQELTYEIVGGTGEARKVSPGYITSH